jgi:uncharacterized membrane protein
MGGLPAADVRSQFDDGGVMVTEGAGEADVQAPQDEPSGKGSGRSRRLLAAFFIGAGINHFAQRRYYEAMVPPSLKDRSKLVVDVSGVAEVVGGVAVLLPWTRRLSGIGLIALLAAIFPANLYMASEPERFRKVPRWALYARLPLQPLMMVWAWKATRR